MRIHPDAAQTLRALFCSKAGKHPFLLHEAKVALNNARGERMEFTAKTPLGIAQMLRHIIVHDGQGVFNREDHIGESELFISMEKRVRLGDDNKEHCLPAFSIEYRSLKEHGLMLVQHPDVTCYQWMDGTQVMDRDPISSVAPKINDLVSIFEEAGESWDKVNFMNIKGSPVVTLVINNVPHIQMG